VPRPLRIEFEGAVYHVTSRGNVRQNIKRLAVDIYSPGLANALPKVFKEAEFVNGQEVMFM
jgi:hypothetical protein